MTERNRNDNEVFLGFLSNKLRQELNYFIFFAFNINFINILLDFSYFFAYIIKEN